jgi:hypothetical protein
LLNISGTYLFKDKAAREQAEREKLIAEREKKTVPLLFCLR